MNFDYKFPYIDTEKENINVVVRFSALGDVILTTGVLLYHYMQTQEQFIVITQESFKPLFENNPAVIACIGLKKNDLKTKTAIPLFKKLAQKYPFPLYDLHATLRSKLLKLCWKKKTYTYNKNPLARRLFLYSHKKIRSVKLDLHVCERYLEVFTKEKVLPSNLLPKIFLTDAEQKQAENTLQAYKKPPVALHLFATHEAKTWSEEHWKELWEKLNSQGIPTLFIGEGKPFPWIPENENFIGKTSLRSLAALLEKCFCLVSADSGPAHLATAVGLPVITLFGPTTKEWGFFPQGEKNQVAEINLSCRPCSLHGKLKRKCPNQYKCMNNISTEHVYDYVLNNNKR